MTLLTKEKLDSIKLKQDEAVTLNTFIGVSVRGNYTFTLLTNRAGVSPAMNIQEIYNQNIPTLSTYGELLAAQNAKQGSATFDALGDGPRAYMTPGNNEVKATDMLDILRLVIREKTYFIESAKKAGELRNLKATLDNMATPEEQKAKLIQQIATLEAQA
jgi:hypothetical protein